MIIEWDFTRVAIRIEEEATPDEPSKLAVFFRRYWLFICVPLFLAGAYFYIHNLGPKYRVTAKVQLHGMDASAAINGIKSKPLVSKALSQLPFQVSFYNDTMPQKEVYPDSVPVKLVFSSITNTHPNAQIAFRATNGAQVAVTNGDTILNHNYHETITEPYGKFKVVQNPLAKPDDQTYIVKINDADEQAEHYFKNLRVEGSRNGTLTVSLLTANGKKGTDFLAKLLHLYANQTHSALAVDKRETNISLIPPNVVMIYVLAFLAGLSIPLAWPRVANKLKIGGTRTSRLPEAYSFLFERPLVPEFEFSVEQMVNQANH